MEFGLLQSPIKNLSPSKVEGYLKCPEQFRLRYVEKVPQQSPLVMTSGIAVHGALEYALVAKKLGASVPSEKELDDVFLNRWKSSVAREEHKRDFLGWSHDEGDGLDVQREECRALVPLAAREVIPLIDPRDIETDVKLLYPSDYGEFLVWGKADVIDASGVIWDWKTTKKISSAAKKSTIQFPHYARLLIENGVDHGGSVPVRKVFLVRGERPRVEVVEFKLTRDDVDKWAELAADVWGKIQRNEYPTNPTHFLCKAIYCPFYVPCQGWSA